MTTDSVPHARSARVAALLAGPIAFGILLAAPPLGGLPPTAQAVAAVVAWMAIWWLTEAVPIAATALLPIVLLPLVGDQAIDTVTRRYGDNVIFLFLGGFILSIAVQKWGLHRRVALAVLRRTGTTPRRVLLGFMLATALLSMWFSNSATAIMMVPVAAAAIAHLPRVDGERKAEGLSAALLLAIAYGATIGGLGTIIGSPPNAIFVGYAKSAFGVDITFLQWMLFGVPLAIVAGAIAYLYLAFVAFRRVTANGASLTLPAAPADPLSGPEARVLGVFLVVAAGWLLRGVVGSGIPALAPLSDAGIAIAGAIALFALPAYGASGPRLLDWSDLAELPWGVLILFGGGLALAGAVQSSGLAQWIASGSGALQGLAPVLVLGAVAMVIIFLTEITSNTATASVFMPIVAAFALAADFHPFMVMMIASTAASCAFMLPVATPPNAIVFATGHLTIPKMARVGLALNLLLVPVLAAAAAYVLPVLWGLGGR
jgi:solute carrier family 13 (sodium-dependent dicarboxylate transporter), member 2/3/5